MNVCHIEWLLATAFGISKGGDNSELRHITEITIIADSKWIRSALKTKAAGNDDKVGAKYPDTHVNAEEDKEFTSA